MKKEIIRFVRTFIVNTLATTALTVFIMCFIALIQGFTLWGLSIPYEMLLLNIVMHLGFYFIQKLDFKYYLLTLGLQFIYLLGLIIGFGFLFQWFSVNTIWIICLGGLVVYVISIFIDLIKIRNEVTFINDKLKRINKVSEK